MKPDPAPHPSPEDRARTTSLVRAAVVVAATLIFFAFVGWIVVTGS